MVWLIALALAAGADAGHPQDFLEVPGAFSKTDVPKGLKALGVPVQLSAVLTREKPGALDTHFRRAFERAGLFVPAKGEIDDVGPLQQVTGVDVRSRTSFSVLFQPNPDGTTTVIVGRAALHAAQPQDPPFAPIFPGGASPLLSDVEAGRTLSYSAPASPDEVLAFYRATLPRSGFKQTAPNAFVDERSGAALQVWATAREGGTAVVVVRHERGTP
jgi:hypothetical protein